MRSQIELYKIQHEDRYPGDDNDDGVEDIADAFEADLTTITNASGTTLAADGALVFGPYLQRFPTNPFAPAAANTVETGAADPLPAAGTDTSGWYFSYALGQIMANDTDSTTTGILHCTL